MMTDSTIYAICCYTLLVASSSVLAWAPPASSHHRQHHISSNRLDSFLFRSKPTIRSMSLGATEEKAAALVSGEELERMLTEWDQPLVVDAYATWCGPCLLMAPEFEKAAQELKGRVRFVKLDTDKEEAMAARLNIMGLPTLLFLEKYEPKEEEAVNNSQSQAKAVLKGRIEGALRKDAIIDLCEFYFFGGPEPGIF